MTSRRGNETRDESHQIVVHVPGYRSVVVAAITVDTSALVCANVGFSMRSRSTAMRFNAVLSSTTTQSALRVSLFRVNSEL